MESRMTSVVSGEATMGTDITTGTTTGTATIVVTVARLMRMLMKIHKPSLTIENGVGSSQCYSDYYA